MTIEQSFEKEKKYVALITRTEEFLESSGFKKINSQCEEDEDYLDWVEEHPEEFEEGGNILIDDVAWKREIVEATSEKGAVIRDGLAFYDKVSRVRATTRARYNNLSITDNNNVLDFYDNDSDEYKQTILNVRKELEEYDYKMTEFKSYIDKIVKDVLSEFIEVSLQVSTGDEKVFFERLEIFLNELDEETDIINLDNVEYILNNLKKYNIVEEEVKDIKEKVKQSTKERIQKKQQQRDLERRKQEKIDRKKYIGFLEERGRKDRRDAMKIAANSMDDVGVSKKMAQLGVLDTGLLQELYELTQKVERLQNKLHNIVEPIRRFVRNNRGILERELNIKFTPGKDFENIEQLEVLIKICILVEKLAEDYGLNDYIDLTKFISDDEWEEDVFSKIEKIII